MISKTEAIVLRIIPYSDKASIATLYTREYGLVAYMVYGLSSKKSSVRSSCFIPLSIIEITASHFPNRNIQQLKEAKVSHSLTDIYCHPLKNALAMFIAELLFKSLKYSESETHLYDFLQDAILKLDSQQSSVANFHLVFMSQLSFFLGFSPNTELDSASYFDLLHGEFTHAKPLHDHYINKDLTQLFASLLKLDLDDSDALKIGRATRNQILDLLIQYYQLHIPEFGNLKSLDVLRELFS